MLCASRFPKFLIFVKMTTSLAGTFIFYRVQKFCSSKKLQGIECCYLASIWRCFDQHYIGESIEMLNLMLQFALIVQWNAEQSMSRSMPDSSIQLVVTFCSNKIKVPTSDVVFFTKIKNSGKRDAHKIFRRIVHFSEFSRYLLKDSFVSIGNIN